MKRFVVDQHGIVEVEASRSFIVEVPDHISEEQVQELIANGPLPDEDGMEWWDTPDRKWLGYDVDIEETVVYEPENPGAEGLSVIRLEVEDVN